MDAQDSFPGPPGFDELSGLDLSHLSAEERAVILQVAARAKQIEEVEQQKIRNIEDQVALYSHNARKNITKPSNVTNSKHRKEVGNVVKNSHHDTATQDQALDQKNANSKEQKTSGDKEKNECHFCSKKLNFSPKNDSNSSQKKHGSKSIGSSQEGKDPDYVRPSSGHCSFCKNPVCSDCTVHSTLLAKGLLCVLCAKQRELVARSNLWLKSTKKSHLQRSQSVDTTLRRSHSEIGQDKINESESSSKAGRKLERRRSQSDPSSHGKSRRDSCVKTSKRLSRSSTHNPANNLEVTIKKDIAAQPQTSYSNVKITAESTEYEKVNIPHSRGKSYNNSLSTNTPSNKRKSSLTRQISMADGGTQHSQMPRKSFTDTRDSGKTSDVSADGAKTNPKTTESIASNNDALASKTSKRYGTNEIKQLSKPPATAPTSAKDIVSTSTVTETVSRFSAKKDEIAISTSTSSVIDRYTTAGEVVGLQTSQLKDRFQGESIKTISTPSATTTIVSTSSSNFIRPVSSSKETLTKTPSAMPRKAVGKTALGADQMKASLKQNVNTYKPIDPPKVLPRKSSLSTAFSGDDERITDAATNETSRILETFPKKSIKQEIEDYHYHMDENDTEGDFDHILSCTTNDLQMDSMTGDSLPSDLTITGTNERNSKVDYAELSEVGHGSDIHGVTGTPPDGKTDSILASHRIDKGKQYKPDESAASIGSRVRKHDNAKVQENVHVSLPSSQVQKTFNENEKIKTEKISEEKAPNIAKSNGVSKPEGMPKTSYNDPLKSTDAPTKPEERKTIGNEQNNGIYVTKTTPQNYSCFSPREKAADKISPRSIKPASTTKHRRMPLPSTTSSTAYTIKQPPSAITNTTRKWQIEDQLSDLDTDLRDFEEKMKENMRILSGDATPTSLTESDDEDEMLRSATTSIPTFPSSAVGQRGFSSFQPHRSERSKDIRAKPKKLANMFMKRTTSTDSFSDLLKESESPPRSSRHMTSVIAKSTRTYRKDRESPTPSTAYSNSKKEQYSSTGNIRNKETLDVKQNQECCDRRHSLPTSCDPPHVRSTFSDPCDLRSQGNMQRSPVISISAPNDDNVKKLMESSIEGRNARREDGYRSCGTNGVGSLAEGLARCFSCGTIATQAISASSSTDVKTRIVSGTSSYSPITVTPKPSTRSVDSSTQVSPAHEDSYSKSFADGGLSLSDLKKIKTLIEALTDTSDLDELVVNKQSQQSPGISTKYCTTQTDTFSDREIPPERVDPRERVTIKRDPYNANEFPASQMKWYPNGTQSMPTASIPLGNWNRNVGLPSGYPQQNPEFANGIPMHQNNFMNPLNERLPHPVYRNDELETSHNTMHSNGHPNACHTRFPYGGMPPPQGTHFLPDSTYYYTRGFASPYQGTLSDQSGQFPRYQGDTNWQGQMPDYAQHNCQPITTQPRSTSLHRNEFNEFLLHRGQPTDGQQNQVQSRDASLHVSIEKSSTVSPMSHVQELVKTSHADVHPAGHLSASNLRKCSSVPTGLNSDKPEKVMRGDVVGKHARPPFRNQIDDTVSLYENEGYSGPDDIDQYHDHYYRRKRYPSNPTKRRIHQYENEYSDNEFAEYYDEDLHRDEDIMGSNSDSFAIQSRQNRGRFPSNMHTRRNPKFEMRRREPSYHSSRNDDYPRKRRYDQYNNSRPFPRSYSAQRDYDGFPRSISRRSLPEPPEDDEYSWRYEQVKLLNRAKFPTASSNVPPRSNRLEMRGSNQIEVNRLQQTMDDLDQEERELDLRLKYLEVGRSRRSTMNSLHEDMMQGRDYRYEHDMKRHTNQTNLETNTRGGNANAPAAAPPSVDKGQSSRSVSIYDFISDMPDESDSSSKQENVMPHRTSRHHSAARNYAIVDDTSDILPSGQQTTGFNLDRQHFHADVGLHQSAGGSEMFKREYDMGPAPNHHPTGTDYQSRYRRRLQENATGRVTNQRRSQGNSRVSDFVDFQSGGSFDNGSYYPTYFSQRQSYRLPPQTRFNRYQTKKEPKFYPENNSYVCATDNIDAEPCVKSNLDHQHVKNRHFENQAYAELATTIVDMDVRRSKEKIHVDPEKTAQKPGEQQDRRHRQSQMRKLDLLDDDMRSVVSDSEAYHLGKETTTWFDKPSDNEMQ